jgi:hypothetical protein
LDELVLTGLELGELHYVLTVIEFAIVYVILHYKARLFGAKQSFS